MERRLLIGLGNPGGKYSGTYHNVGWEVLNFFKEKLEKIYGPSPLRSAGNFHFLKYGDLSLVYPDTFMNASGGAVAETLRWFGLGPEDAAVFHDDSDLAVGEFREGAGGAAGHHGVESILRVLGDAPVLRIRIGVRHPLEKSGERERRKAGDFVLKKISAPDAEKLRSEVFEQLALRFLD